MGLLEHLDRIVTRDTAPAGFKGTSVSAFADQAGVRWWVAQFEDATRTAFLPAMPRFDVAVGLDEAAASALIKGEAPAIGSLRAISGNRDLLERFCRRYLQRMSLVGVRSGGGPQ